MLLWMLQCRMLLCAIPAVQDAAALMAEEYAAVREWLSRIFPTFGHKCHGLQIHMSYYVLVCAFNSAPIWDPAHFLTVAQ